MTPEREAKIWATFARREAEGYPLAAITNKLIYDEIRGKKGDISTVGAVWRAQQRTAQATNGTAAVLDVPPGDQEAVGGALDRGAVYAEGAPCRLTDGLPAAPVPAPRVAPRLLVLALERQTLVREIEQLQRRLQQVSQEEQQARFTERRTREALHVATRRAQQAPPHEQLAAFESQAACRRALAALIGEDAASRAYPV